MGFSIVSPDGSQRKLASEDEFWAFLATTLDKTPMPEGTRIEIAASGDGQQDWTTVRFRYWLESGENGVVTPPIMRALLDLQDAVLRSREQLVEGRSDLRHLSDAERKRYEIKAKVDEGSTKLSIDLKDIISSLIGDLVGKMTGEQILYIGLAVIGAFASVSVAKAWLENKKDEARDRYESDRLQKLLDSQRFAADADIARSQLFAKLIEREPAAAVIEENAEKGRAALVRAVGQTGRAELQGIEIEPDIARRIARSTPPVEEAGRLDGEFDVLGVDTTVPDGFRVQLRLTENGEKFSASVRDKIVSDRDRILIQNGEWSKTPIRAQINTISRDGRIVEAVIVKVLPPVRA